MGFTQLPIGSGGGPSGPPGPPGPPGPGGIPANVFTQSVASLVWLVNHNLGYVPLTALYTSGSVEFEGEVVHSSVNQFSVILQVSSAGFVRYI